MPGVMISSASPLFHQPPAAAQPPPGPYSQVLTRKKGSGGEDDDEDRSKEDDTPVERRNAVVLDMENLSKTHQVTFPRKRPRATPSAMAYLQGLVSEGSNELSSPAQTILKDLLRETNFVLDEPKEDVDSTAQIVSTREQAKRVVHKDMTDEEIIQLAKQNKLAYLASFLQTIEEADDEPVSARHLTKRCALAIHAAYVPGGLDGEELALAALEFLESELETHNHPHWPRFPLIQSNRDNDIRKRLYTKAYPWKLSEILDSVVYLDSLFVQDPSDFIFLRREAFSPWNLEDECAENLIFKGKILRGNVKLKNKKPKKRIYNRGGGSSQASLGSNATGNAKKSTKSSSPKKAEATTSHKEPADMASGSNH